MEVKHSDEKSSNATLSEPTEQFWNDLFLLNAKIDIMIDEEEAPEAVEGAIISGISKKLHFQEPTPILFLQSLIDEAKKVFQDQKSIRNGAAKLQNVWQDIWQNHIKNMTVDTNVRLNGSVFLLFLGKFCRSKYLSLSQENSGKTTIDFISHFLAANVNIAIEKDNTIRPIQVLLYMECAACAPPEASLGFLKMAEAVTAGNNIQAIFPGYRALRNYNRAIALNHWLVAQMSA